MAWWDKTALILAAIGAINWGLTELGFNLVSAIFDSWAPIIATIVYYLVGISGLVVLIKLFVK
jgi:uncharacterized membrane protein YuzA (DUF378 family)